ncbi:MAG: hypothetical protein IJ553_00030 [Alloprevotella sp.]|nr:hypothetical protein [Alloprevotella sp.]
MNNKHLTLCLLSLASVFSLTFAVASCSDDDEANTQPASTECLDLLRSDYRAVAAEYSVASGRLVEAQYKLNGSIAELPLKDIKPVEVVYIFNLGWNQQESTCTILAQGRNFETGDVSEISELEFDTPWLSDRWISDLSNLISLEQAIANVKNSAYDDPDTRFVTLRYPVMAFDKGNALYVFGGSPSREKHILVNAVTGEVYELTDNIPEESDAEAEW